MRAGRGPESWSISGAAEILEVHPFEVVRLLAAGSGLPADLRLRAEDMARVVANGGMEAWWEEPSQPRPTAEDLRPLAYMLLERRIVEPAWTRADNLYRGLPAPAQVAVRRAVNDWIRSGTMGSRMTGRGLEVTVRAEQVSVLRAVATGVPSAGGRRGHA